MTTDAKHFYMMIVLLAMGTIAYFAGMYPLALLTGAGGLILAVKHYDNLNDKNPK